MCSGRSDLCDLHITTSLLVSSNTKPSTVHGEQPTAFSESVGRHGEHCLTLEMRDAHASLGGMTSPETTRYLRRLANTVRRTLVLMIVCGSLPWFLSACGDDEDPATSQRCKDARAQWLEIKQLGDRAAEAAAGIAARNNGHGGAYDRSYLSVLANI